MKNSVKVLFLFLILTITNCSPVFALNKTEKAEFIKQLSSHSLIISKDGNVSISDGRGIKPLLDYVEKSDLKGAYAFDKIVGRAAARLYVYGDVKFVYADTISKPATKILKKNHIKYQYANLTDEIINRTKTDLCPFEKLTKNVKDSETAYKLIKQKVSELSAE